jgi:hypothetical protein
MIVLIKVSHVAIRNSIEEKIKTVVIEYNASSGCQSGLCAKIVITNV